MARIFSDTDYISINYTDVEAMLKEFALMQKSWARQLMQAVNNEAVKRIKKEARARGYSAHNQQSWGDSGYTKNIKGYANNDFSGKVSARRNAFYYRFIESGANVHWKNKKGNFYYKPKPFIKTTAAEVWAKEGSSIMQKKYEQLIKKWSNKKYD